MPYWPLVSTGSTPAHLTNDDSETFEGRKMNPY